LRVTVCQIPNEPGPLALAWAELCRHVATERADLVLLPEMPFHPWLAATENVDREAWQRAVADHVRWCDRLSELGAPAVVGSRPVSYPEPRNRAFAWRQADGLGDLHDKVYLPDEDGFWEATWYRPGVPDYRLASMPLSGGGVAKVGVLLCTEMWFLERARAYGRAGAHIVAVPRATPASTLDKWIAGGRTAAVVSGAYCLSAAPFNVLGEGADLGGGAWIIDPEGELLALTTPDEPFATREISTEIADAAKSGYPRYVPEVSSI